MTALTNNQMRFREVRLGGIPVQTAVSPNSVEAGLVLHDQDAGTIYYRVNDALDHPGWLRCCTSGPTGALA